MRLDIIAAIVAVGLFIGYYAPLIVKLKDLPLSIVLLGGMILVAVDVWESFKNNKR